MIWILAIGIAIILGIKFAYDIGFSWLAYVGWPIIWLILCLLIALLFGVFVSMVPPEVEKTELVKTTEIIAMNDNVGTEGWYRHVEQEGKYWVLSVSDKGTKMIDFPVDKTYVVYTTDEPRVETYYCYAKSGLRTFLFTKEWFTTTEYIIYVPEDANITNDFVVDLQ